MSDFVAWIDNEEPLTVDDLVAHARLGTDEATALASYLETVVIPAARQLAETRAGAAIRRATYQDHRTSVPRGAIQLGMGQAYAVESLTIAGQLQDPSSYSLLVIDKDPRVIPSHGRWPHGPLTVVYNAGIEDMSRYPSVKNWMLLAAAWMLEQPSMFTLEQAVQSMPASYVDSLLAPISVDCRV